ncbi:MAG: dihydroorotate dehydrogenase electron transfer subunit [Rubrobacteridae bacterium]|nr:dihydroorotate dehydrogenase electron transfer subunit [Rubrobacteridae bacterium]
MYQVKADVIAKEEILPGVFSITFISPEISKAARPGQFVNISCCGENSNFILRRPFSIHSVVPGRVFEILFQVVGKGTQVLSSVKQHDVLDIIGPLGNGFSFSEDIKSALLIGGGIGVAPLLYLAEELTARKVMIYSMIGAQNKHKMIKYIDFKRLSKKTFAATDDGSFGHEGTVVDLLNRTIHQLRPQVIYACGPHGMLKQVVLTADDFAVDCQVSIESRMACGIGACLGCVCETKSGFKMTCKDGPVFNAKDLIWDEPLNGKPLDSAEGCGCEAETAKDQH